MNESVPEQTEKTMQEKCQGFNKMTAENKWVERCRQDFCKVIQEILVGQGVAELSSYAVCPTVSPNPPVFCFLSGVQDVCRCPDLCIHMYLCSLLAGCDTTAHHQSHQKCLTACSSGTVRGTLLRVR